MTNKPTLILASASPRRKELLATIVADYLIIPSGFDEDALIAQHAGDPPQNIVQMLALAKASDVAKLYTESVVIGADTVVVIDGDILGKPTEKDHAKAMLRRLSGRWHDVYTGIAVVSQEQSNFDAILTRVKFKALTDAEIDAYVATGEPMDKAGAYGIQNKDITPVEGYDGDYYNVMGLPLAQIRSLLLKYYPQLPPPPSQPSRY